MSCIDYAQTAEDHQSLLVLVRHTGTHLTNQIFSTAWERIRRLSCIHVQGQKRNVYVRYKRGYPKENNAWGDFQSHRKVLGLISIGKCSTVSEFEALFEDYKKIKEDYSGTIFNSRLMVYGMNPDGSPLNSSSSPDKTSEDKNSNANSSAMKDNVDGITSTKATAAASNTDNVNKESSNGKDSLKRSHSKSLTKESTGAEVVFYGSLDSTDLEERLKEFVTSLFYVLEGKRLDRSFERADRLHLLCAPFEKKDFVGVDTDTRSFKKKCTGRLRKHLADLCLQAGMPGEAILHYQTAIDLLRSVNDFLWIGGCFEGLSSSSVIMAHPKMSAAATIKRNLSFHDKRNAAVASDKTRSATLSNNYANSLDLAEMSGSSGLNPDDIIDKYREAITHYSKFKNAGMIEMEASLKACRVLISQRKYLQASDFLQNVVYINLQVSEEDKIQRFGTLATLYSQIGFHRKAGFFKRIAGMQCVSPQTSAWHQCYYLLLQTLPGYRITLDTRTQQDKNNGWPTLHHRLLTELVYAARRMGNPQLAVRHMSFLLHTMFDHLTVPERREAVNGLVSLTSKCEGSSQSITLDKEHILPPVPFTRFPFVKSFTLMNLLSHLQPLKMNRCEVERPKDVFIFTPISVDKGYNFSNSKADFVWVCGEMCEVQTYVVNPLPDELKVSYMGLMTDGQIELEVFPANPSLAAESNPSLVKLMCKPKSVGQLNILGYSTHVLGVHSQCYLKDLPHIENTQTTVEVIPPLPQITLKSSLPKSASFTTIGEGANVVASASITVFAGQSQECTLSLENVSEIPVSHLSIILDTKPHLKEFLQNVFSWSDVNIQSQLPLLQTTTLCVSVCLYGYSDFMSPEATSELPSPVYSNRSRSDSSDNKLTEALLSVEYSGTVGFDAGYCRQGSLAVTVDILPSLYIINWDVQHTDSNNNCLVMLDLENVSNHQLEITYNNNQSLIIVPQQARRICIEISRVEFPPCPVEDVDLNNTNITSSWTNTNKPVNHYSRYLSNFIDINWAMSATKITGKVCIDHLTWTPSQLNTLQVSNTSWEVRLNEQLYLAPDIPTFTTGQIVYIKAVIFNNAGGNCEDVKLSVIPTQCTDGDTGTNSTLVTERNMFINNNNNNNNNMLPLFEDNQALTVIDSNVSFCKLLSEKDSALIVCAFVFFHPGLFTFDITCCYSNTESEDRQTWKCIPRPHVVIVD